MHQGQVIKAVDEQGGKVLQNDDYARLINLAKESSRGICQSLRLIKALQTEQVIHGLLVLPLEIKMQENELSFAQQACQSYREFLAYHLGISGSFGLPASMQREEDRVELIAGKLAKLQQLQAASGSRLSEHQQGQLRPLLAFVNNLLGEVRRLEDGLAQLKSSDGGSNEETRERCKTIVGLLESS